MLFDWLDTKEAALIGVKLADSLSTELAKTNNKNLKNQMEARAKVMQKVFVQVDQYKQSSKNGRAPCREKE